MSMPYRVFLKTHLVPRSLYSNYTELVPLHYPTDKAIDELRDWCKETIGTGGWNYYGKYRKIPYEFRFRHGEDCLAFKLKFGIYD